MRKIKSFLNIKACTHVTLEARNTIMKPEDDDNRAPFIDIFSKPLDHRHGNATSTVPAIFIWQSMLAGLNTHICSIISKC